MGESAFRDSHLSVHKNSAIMTRSAATVNNSKGRSRFFALFAFVFFIIVAAVLLHRRRMLSLARVRDFFCDKETAALHCIHHKGMQGEVVAVHM